MSKKEKERIDKIITSILVISLWLSLGVGLIVFGGCAAKERIVYQEVPIPYPTKCKYALPTKIRIDSSTYRTKAESLKQLKIQRDYLYESIKLIPCIELVNEYEEDFD